MSNYNVISAVSNELRGILWRTYQADIAAGNLDPDLMPSEQAIAFTNPTQTARETDKRLSLWLYRITENEFVKNQPALRRNGEDTLTDPPLALNLFYLITPFAPAQQPDGDHLLLGATMQALYDHAIMPLQAAGPVYEELRVILCRVTLEELTRIWEALREPYRLSLCYQLRVTRIDSRQSVQHSRVNEVSQGYLPPDTRGSGS